MIKKRKERFFDADFADFAEDEKKPPVKPGAK